MDIMMNIDEEDDDDDDGGSLSCIPEVISNDDGISDDEIFGYKEICKETTFEELLDNFPYIRTNDFLIPFFLKRVWNIENIMLNCKLESVIEYFKKWIQTSGGSVPKSNSIYYLALNDFSSVESSLKFTNDPLLKKPIDIHKMTRRKFKGGRKSLSMKKLKYYIGYNVISKAEGNVVGASFVYCFILCERFSSGPTLVDKCKSINYKKIMKKFNTHFWFCEDSKPEIKKIMKIVSTVLSEIKIDKYLSYWYNRYKIRYNQKKYDKPKELLISKLKVEQQKLINILESKKKKLSKIKKCYNSIDSVVNAILYPNKVPRRKKLTPIN
jgi:hypothetical protein